MQPSCAQFNKPANGGWRTFPAAKYDARGFALALSGIGVPCFSRAEAGLPTADTESFSSYAASNPIFVLSSGQSFPRAPLARPHSSLGCGLSGGSPTADETGGTDFQSDAVLLAHHSCLLILCNRRSDAHLWKRRWPLNFPKTGKPASQFRRIVN